MAKAITSGGPVLGPYSPALQLGGRLYISGQIAIDPETGQLLEADISTQTRLVMEAIGRLLKAAGLDYEHLVKTTIFLADINDFAQVNKVYEGYLHQPYPARSTIEVAALPKGARIEIEAMAEA